jgi:hypothetical protein
MTQGTRVNIRYLTDHPLLGYLDNHRLVRVARREPTNFRPLIRWLGWILAGTLLGSLAVIGGLWAFLSF